MADETLWPLPKFYFKVTFSDLGEIACQEVSGLDVEAQVIEYRHGNSKEFSTIKMPGIKKYSNITLKKGVFKDDKKFWQWFNKIQMNTFERETVTISLLDESNTPAMSWSIKNAWPTKVTGTDFKSDGNEVAVETLEIAHEGITLVEK
ncbi:MAG: phage tail protein [Bacteroides sp.]|nr:phage tail protein [Bacteroides sp.]